MRNDEKGFTLIEVLVAIVLLSMTFVLFYQIVGFTSLSDTREKSKQEAIDFANEKLHQQLNDINSNTSLTDIISKTTTIQENKFEGCVYIRDYDGTYSTKDSSCAQDPENYVFTSGIVRVIEQEATETQAASYVQKVIEVAIRWRD